MNRILLGLVAALIATPASAGHPGFHGGGPHFSAPHFHGGGPHFSAPHFHGGPHFSAPHFGGHPFHGFAGPHFGHPGFGHPGHPFFGGHPDFGHPWHGGPFGHGFAWNHNRGFWGGGQWGNGWWGNRYAFQYAYPWAYRNPYYTYNYPQYPDYGYAPSSVCDLIDPQYWYLIPMCAGYGEESYDDLDYQVPQESPIQVQPIADLDYGPYDARRDPRQYDREAQPPPEPVEPPPPPPYYKRHHHEWWHGLELHVPPWVHLRIN